MKSLNSLQPLGLLVLRVVLGLIFFSHGYPKLAYSAAGIQGFFVQHVVHAGGRAAPSH